MRNLSVCLLSMCLLWACARERLAVSPAPGAAANVTLRYLGVAGWEISAAGHSVLVDPYFSRPDLDTGAPLQPDPVAIAERAPARADLVLISHSHADHALDAAAVAAHTGATLLGSLSTSHLAQAAGLPADRIVPVQGGEDYAFDGFSVRVFPSLHSALDHKHTYGASSSIAADATLPMRFEDYVEGGTLAFLVRIGGARVLVLGTANFIERELEGVQADVAIVATGLRTEIHDYSCRIVELLGHPPLVLANHFDDWRAPFRVLSRGELAADTRADLDRFEAEVRACSPNTRVIVPTHGVAYTYPLR
jgi:L-ascorbate metabolism protein UlaG (beta-lactamase superfamily)